MNMEKACKILEINVRSNNLTKDLVKKQYHKQALKYHPDKNGHTESATQKFQQINEAYNYILNEPDLSFVSSEEKHETSFDYVSLLSYFINDMINGSYKDIIKDILFGYKKLELKLFDTLDKETALEIYTFLCKYQELLHISSDTVAHVRNIIIEKYNQDKMFILKPSLNDIFENKVYKLMIDNEIYYVPLWHSEVYFDSCSNKKTNKGDIIVFCVPELPKNVFIDEHNNLLVNISLSSQDLFQKKHASFLLDTREFHIPLDKLYIKKEQVYIFFKEGISQIEKDIYNVYKKGDIIVNISIS